MRLNLFCFIETFLSRFLLTKSVLPLKQYNPFAATLGPWCIRDNAHYVQKEYLSPRSRTYRLDLEFMLGDKINLLCLAL